MIPRDYQQEAVTAARTQTNTHGNTILVLPTGAGKTAVAGFYIGEETEAQRDTRVLVLQHTDELIEQNLAAIGKVTGLPATVVKAERNDWSGHLVFGSVQTLGRVSRRSAMQPVTHLIIDECHRAAAESYQGIIAHAKLLNPEVKLLGLSATPSRGDGRSLRKTFSNIGYQLKIGTLIARGLLVPPRTFTIDLGIDDELACLDAMAGDYDMRAASRVLNRQVLNETVVGHWKERAGDRRSLFFCATVEHANAVSAAFRAAGITAETVSGEMPSGDRADLISRFDKGEVQVLANCMVLTEGFDSQPVGCIGILRPMLHKGTFIQAIGRGLRRVDPERYPGIVKTDCIVMDFAGAALRHGTIEQDIALEDDEEQAGETPYKSCPSCDAEIPLSTSACPFCGHAFVREPREKSVLERFQLTEVDLLERSPFAWHDISGEGTGLMASGFNAWAGVFCDGTLWHAVGRPKHRALKRLAIGTKTQALAAADDFLREAETTTAAAKSRRWLSDAASLKQRELLQKAGLSTAPLDFGMSKYSANCQLNFLWNRAAITEAVLGPGREVAA